MTRTRSTTALRFGGMMIDTEALESRRMFAGMPGPHPGFGPPGPGPHIEAALFVARLALPLGGPMNVTSDGTTTTAASTLGTVPTPPAPMTPVANVAAQRSATAADDAVVVVRPTSVVSTPATIAVRTQADDTAAVVRQVEQAAPAAFTATLASSASARQAADADGPVFGPFTVDATTDTQAAPAANGLGSLLTLNPDAVDKSLRWQAQDAAVHARRDANPQARQSDESLDVERAAEAVVTNQAALPGLPADVAVRPVWQRLAVATAGMTLVAANWVVRRRQRRVGLRAAR